MKLSNLWENYSGN